MSSRLVVLLLSLPLLILAWTAPAVSSGDPAKDLPPKLVSLTEKDIPLSKALASFKKQTGIEVVPPAGDDPKITLDFKQLPFWQALDEIGKPADLRVYPYLRDGKFSLQKGRRELPTSYSGPFRVTLKRISVTRDLDSETSTTKATLEVAWPPPLEMFLLKTDAQDLVVQDDKENTLPAPRGGGGYGSVYGKNAVEIEIKLPSVPRSAPHLGLIKGNLSMIGAARMLTFTFDKIEKGKSQIIDGVTAELTEVKTPKDLWTVQVHLKYPPGGPKFESFQAQSCLIGNQAYLVRRETRISANRPEAMEAPANEASIRYRFGDDDKELKLGSPGDYRLEYRAPAPLVEVSIPFEFKNVPLP